MLSSGMITPPFFIFPGNFTHSSLTSISICHVQEKNSFIFLSNLSFLNILYAFSPKKCTFFWYANSNAFQPKIFYVFLHLLKLKSFSNPKSFKYKKTELSASSVGKYIAPTVYQVLTHTRYNLCAHCMIWLLAYPLPLLPSVSSTGDAQEDWERETTGTCWRERERRGWTRSRITRPQEAWSSNHHSMLSGLS